MNNSKKLINILQIIDAAPYGGAQKIAISIHRYASSKNYKFHYLLINRDDKEHKSRAIFEKFGYSFIEPGEGYLACGYVGKGRLEEPETIVEKISDYFNKSVVKLNLVGKIDQSPVRPQAQYYNAQVNRSE